MALKFTPYHRFKSITTTSDWTVANSGIVGNYTSTADDDAVRDNADFATGLILKTPKVTSNSLADDTLFSEIIPPTATIIGFQFRYYYKWFSGGGQKSIHGNARIGNGGSYGSNFGAVGVNIAMTTPQLETTDVTLGGLSFSSITDLDDIQVQFTTNKLTGTSPRIAIMAAGFGDATYEASPAIRVQYQTTNRVHVLNTSKISITGTSKLTVD